MLSPLMAGLKINKKDNPGTPGTKFRFKQSGRHTAYLFFLFLYEFFWK